MGHDSGDSGRRRGPGGVGGIPSALERSGVRALHACAGEWLEVRKGQGKDTQDMRSEQAKIGASVRVSDSGLHSELRGLTGTVSGMWGHPEYLALDVRMEDGHSELFWHYELEEIAKRA